MVAHAVQFGVMRATASHVCEPLHIYDNWWSQLRLHAQCYQGRLMPLRSCLLLSMTAGKNAEALSQVLLFSTHARHQNACRVPCLQQPRIVFARYASYEYSRHLVCAFVCHDSTRVGAQGVHTRHCYDCRMGSFCWVGLQYRAWGDLLHGMKQSGSSSAVIREYEEVCHGLDLPKCLAMICYRPPVRDTTRSFSCSAALLGTEVHSSIGA
jgi:hypothetical protein